jgi:hypothetical protein
VRQFLLFEQLPFVRVARIAGFDRQGARSSAENNVDDVRERNVAVVRPFVITSADVHAHLLRRDVPGGVIQRLHIEPSLTTEILQTGIVELDVTAHRKIRAIELKDDTGLGDCLVLFLHGVGNCGQVGFAVWVVVIGERAR